MFTRHHVFMKEKLVNCVFLKEKVAHFTFLIAVPSSAKDVVFPKKVPALLIITTNQVLLHYTLI